MRGQRQRDLRSGPNRPDHLGALAGWQPVSTKVRVEICALDHGGSD